MDFVLVLTFSGSEMGIPVSVEEAERFAEAAKSFWEREAESKYAAVVRSDGGAVVHVNLGRVCAFQAGSRARGHAPMI